MLLYLVLLHEWMGMIVPSTLVLDDIFVLYMYNNIILFTNVSCTCFYTHTCIHVDV